MATKYYRKELPDSPIWVNGAPLRFDILATQDPSLINELETCIRETRGGIIAIQQDEYEVELKKKENGNPSNGDLNRRQWRQELSASALPRSVAEAGSFARPQQPQIPQVAIANGPPKQTTAEPLRVPSPEEFKVQKPPTSKAKKA